MSITTDCPTCGQAVDVVTGGDGTSHYVDLRLRQARSKIAGGASGGSATGPPSGR